MAPTTSTEEGPYLTDLLNRLGGISGRRVLMTPPPGTATEQDLLEYQKRTGRACELVEGTLVEKPMGFAESSIAAELIRLIGNHVVQHDLGIVTGEQGTMRLMPQLVRIPDVSFVSWEKFPDRRLPKERIPDLHPDLAIEVLSEGNTPGEIRRKLKEYFLAGTRAAWVVDPEQRIVSVYSAPDVHAVRAEADTLDGESVLPGFTIPVAGLFQYLPSPGTKRKPRKKRS